MVQRSNATFLSLGCQMSKMSIRPGQSPLFKLPTRGWQGLLQPTTVSCGQATGATLPSIHGISAASYLPQRRPLRPGLTNHWLVLLSLPSRPFYTLIPTLQHVHKALRKKWFTTLHDCLSVVQHDPDVSLLD